MARQTDRHARPGWLHRVSRASVAAWVLAALAVATQAPAHPAPFSYLDLRFDGARIDGSLVAHVIDLAHELSLDDPERLLDADLAGANRARLFALVRARLVLRVDGRPAPFVPGAIAVLPDRQAIRLALRYHLARPPDRVAIQAALFPYDPNHQTFLNVYEAHALVEQRILDRAHTTYEHFTGTRGGTWALVRRFIAAGIHHIVIGPDHVLFLIGLLLLGGNLLALLRIVTAFTLAHSLTLSLAVLGLVKPSARVVEPAIALSIICVGTDNLLAGAQSRDLRAWIALAFGLIHGFGFAGVLAEMNLPRHAIGWTLVAFNAGVEVGQLVIVAAVAALLAAVRQRSAAIGRRVALVGSVTVIAAGAYWFVERVFFSGGSI